MLILAAFLFIQPLHADQLNNWLDHQIDVSLDSIDQAISPEDGALGSVMASPSRSKPNYYYHWIRDAALTMREVFEWRDSAKESSRKMLLNYVNFSRSNQKTTNPSGDMRDRGLGEPKFYMDGGAYWDSWGRPQNDGPALRALVLMDFAYELLEEGKASYVKSHLYDSALPTQTVIKADLEYISHHWKEPSFDLWEEVMDDHFYTRMVQYQALKKGVKFAERMNDEDAAAWYETQSAEIFKSLKRFIDTDRGIIVATLKSKKAKKPSHIMADKSSGLDVAVILGVLHGGNQKGAFSVFDENVLRTAEKLEKTFKDLYPVNSVTVDRDGAKMLPGIGRYPEDTYDGVGTDGVGNPWFIATHALSEFYSKRGEFKLAEGFLRRARYHTAKYGHQSEQFDMGNGIMRGARDLTWSYASFLSAMRMYKK